MKLPFQVAPVAWGAVGGAIVLAIVGFTWGGWVTGGTAEKLATQRAETAVVAAFAPICVERFNASADAAVHLAALKKADTWKQSSFIEEGGWATLPGATKPNSAIAQACVEMLNKAAK